LVALNPDGKCVGYFGILPVMLRVRTELYKAYWFSTWNVSTKVRGMGVGTRLMQAALTLKNDYLIVGSIHARRVCRKFGFLEREPLAYYRMDLSGLRRMNPLTILLRLFRKIVRLLRMPDIKIDITNRWTKIIDGIFKQLMKNIFYKLLSKSQRSELVDVNIKEVSRVQIKPPDGSIRSEVELHRNPDVINWMLEYPWVAEMGTSRTQGMDYYFSDVRDSFKFIALEIYIKSDQNYLGFLVMSVSQQGKLRSLKLLDYLLNDPDKTRIVLGLVLPFAEKYNVDTLEIPLEVAEPLKDRILGKLLLHKQERIYQCSPKSVDSPLAKAWPSIKFKLTDGDMPFT
ncbi:MAG: GNAT family N-acetyltransferase, partial [Anaerolineales bacterium]